MFSPASNDAGASNCRRRPRRIRCRHLSTAIPFVLRFPLTTLLSALLLPHFVIAAERPEPAQAGRAPMALALLSGPGMPGSTTELYLEVQVNGAPMPRIVQLLVGADQHHYVWSDNLRELGIGELPPAQYLDLGAIAGLRYPIDMPAQRDRKDAGWGKSVSVRV